MVIEKLISIASGSSAGAPSGSSHAFEGVGTHALQDLLRMLSAKNGFFAFEGALHVRPWVDSPPTNHLVGIQAWNEKSLWRDWYQGITNGLLFFAEDAFGGQFGVRGEEIVSFDPESGTIDQVADSVEAWANEILTNYRILTGFPAAHAWQQSNGKIPRGKRLLPKIPFILGGTYDQENLHAVDAVKGMRYRGELWLQLRDLPDGAQVKLKPIPLQ